MRLIIIGGGIAGHSACRSALEASGDVEVLLINGEPLPLYSPCLLPRYLAGEITRERLFLPMDYETAGGRVRLMTGVNIVEIDRERKTVLSDRGAHAYDRLILALGGHSVTPPVIGINLPGVFHFKTMNDANKLMKWCCQRPVVVGSGPIGIEVAAALRMRGMKVCLAELLDQIVPAILDVSAARIVQNILVKAGVEIVLGEQVQSLEGKDRVEAILTDNRRIAADSVIFATGIRPNVDLARKAGLKIGRLGVLKLTAF